ncbi:MAG: SDR family oxidoreductase [Desulfobacteraceae bacterium]|nr:SDR family oxidoreductase [Desulfobacteraceae bacterium]
MKNKNRPKLMITGASGFLGDSLCRLACVKHSVLAIYHRHKPLVPDVRAVQADLSKLNNLEALFKTLEPEAVIHAAAVADVAFCQRFPEQSRIINSELPGKLARICRDLNIPFVFTSTDLVFDGLCPPYSERHTRQPLGIYARQKVMAEDAVMQNHPQALICRMPLMIGVAPHDSAYHFCHHMLEAISQKTQLNLFTDEYRTPVDTHSAAGGILNLMDKTGGVLHLGGNTRISRHGIGLMMAESMGIKPDMIRPVRIDDMKLSTPRARDVSLDSQKAFQMGYKPMDLRQAVQRVVKQFNRKQKL